MNKGQDGMTEDREHSGTVTTSTLEDMLSAHTTAESCDTDSGQCRSSWYMQTLTSCRTDIKTCAQDLKRGPNLAGNWGRVSHVVERVFFEMPTTSGQSQMLQRSMNKFSKSLFVFLLTLTNTLLKCRSFPTKRETKCGCPCSFFHKVSCLMLLVRGVPCCLI